MEHVENDITEIHLDLEAIQASAGKPSQHSAEIIMY